MRILISNDDGIYSPGIAALVTVAVLGRCGGLQQPKQFQDDHDNDDHSNYVKNVSIHAGASYQIARAKVNIYPNLSAITAFSFQRRFA